MVGISGETNFLTVVVIITLIIPRSFEFVIITVVITGVSLGHSDRKTYHGLEA